MNEPRAHHVGITVSNLERAVEFYRDVLGLDELARFTVSGEAFSTAIGVEGATGNFAHLDADGARVELIEYEPEGEEHRSQRVNRPGTIHLGLSVSDLDSFYESLPADVETTSEPMTTASGTKILFVYDPEGTLVELLEA